MASVNSASLRDEFDGYKADIDSLRKEGKISKEADVVFSGMCRLLGILIAIFLEKTTKKTSTNSSIPPSQTDKDETKKAPRKDRDTSAAENSMTSENFETTTVEEVSTVEVCDSCGTDLSDVEPCAREQRVLRDIKFTVVDLKVDAEIKDCPECRARTKGRFPENMPGPLQYGNGIKAFMINLLVTQMVSLNRAVGLLQAMSGIKLSEATCLNYIQRLHDELEPWEADTKEHLLTRPALHADETGLKPLDACTHQRFSDTQVPASQAGQGSHRLFRHHSVLHRYVDPRSLGDILFILPVQASGMRVAYPSGSRLCHRLQRIPLGTLDAQVAARDLPRGQPERDRGAERGRMPEVPKKV